MSGNDGNIMYAEMGVFDAKQRGEEGPDCSCKSRKDVEGQEIATRRAGERKDGMFQCLTREIPSDTGWMIHIVTFPESCDKPSQTFRCAHLNDLCTKIIWEFMKDKSAVSWMME